MGNIFDRQHDIRALNSNPVYFDAPLQYDEALIDALIESMYQALYRAPVNAEIIMDSDRPELIGDSAEGQELDRGAAKEQIISLIETGEGSGLLPVMTLEPDMSTELAQSGLELIVEYKTDVSARDYNSRFNVRKALQYFNMRVSPRRNHRFQRRGRPPQRGARLQRGYGIHRQHHRQGLWRRRVPGQLHALRRAAEGGHDDHVAQSPLHDRGLRRSELGCGGH